MGRILGIDFGIKRMGFAISDQLGITAQSLGVYERKSKERDFSFIKELIRKYNIDKIIVGLPLDESGKIDKFSNVNCFVKELKKKIALPVETWDERFTTVEAERFLIQADLSRKKRKRIRDKISAQIILQSYLENKSNV